MNLRYKYGRQSKIFVENVILASVASPEDLPCYHWPFWHYKKAYLSSGVLEEVLQG
jgi:hypothetical protein